MVESPQTTDPMGAFGEIRAMIHQGDAESLRSFMALLDDQEAAFLFRHLDEPQRESLLKLLPPEDLSELLEHLLDKDEPEHVTSFVEALPASETAYVVGRLEEEYQTKLLQQLPPEEAADLLEHFVDELAADLIEELPPADAAAIVDEMDSDDQADVLGELAESDVEAILAKMDPEEAEDVRRLFQYGQEVAGGLMITEYLAFQDDEKIDHVVQELRANVEENREYDVSYIYVVDGEGRFLGVVRLRDLVLRRGSEPLISVMIDEPEVVHVEDPLEKLEDFFDHHGFNVAPVVDDQSRLQGVLRRSAVQAALSERESENLLKFGGIIGGEEIRTMPVLGRGLRRLAFLLPNILLSYLAVSIIAMNESIIAKLTSLAIFLPMVGNLSGAAGNQSVAVSIRELAMGLITPRDVRRVWRNEVLIGLGNGILIGCALAAVAYATRSEHPVVAVSVGAAYVISSVVAVMVGGALPLVLKRVGVDPAMMSSPILTTLTDMCSFLAVLLLAGLFLHYGLAT